MLTAYLPAAKLATQFVAGVGVGKIVAGIIKNNVPVITTVEKVVVGTGSFVLGSMLVEQTSNHIEKMTNELAKPLLEKLSGNNDTEQ